MPVTPLMLIPCQLTQIRSMASAMGQRCKLALSGGRSGDWPAMLFAVTAAVDGWLTLGLVPQSTLIAAAVLRRLARKMHAK